jgi:dienelactone hydrolase
VGQWIHANGSWDKMLPLIQATLTWVQKEGAKSTGYLGLCWGGKIAAGVSAHLADHIKAVAIVHPAMIEAKDAELAKRPWCLLPSKDEPDMVCFILYLRFRNPTGDL